MSVDEASEIVDLVEAIARSATDAGVVVAVAESLTCGGVVHALGAGAGASTWLAGGVVAYRTEVKRSVLGVGDGVPPCSAECAEQLAGGVRELLGADVAISTTGVGGPEGEDGNEPGTVLIGWDDGVTRGHEQHLFDGDPSEVVRRAAAAAFRRLATLLPGRAGQAISSSS